MKKNNIAFKVSVVTIIINTLLSIIKLIAGIVSNSDAMISDGIHTISDVFTTIIAIIGILISSKKADDGHRYGHERLECIASLILSFSLFLTGVGIGYSGILSIINKEYVDTISPGVFALIVAIISIVVKELMYQYTIKAAKVINSDVLKADAWHHRTDSISSVGALLGIILSRIGYKYFDPLASVFISIFICKVAVEIFMDATDKLVDKSCDIDKVNAIKKVVLHEKGVLGIDDIKTRMFGNKVYVDIEISLDGNKTLFETHSVAERVHDKVEKNFPEVKHCMVHVNPYLDVLKK
ncbi:MAG: cation transporter [Bacilli bacterium]|nr:cation transporter [Bacilli bacterium]